MSECLNDSQNNEIKKIEPMKYAVTGLRVRAKFFVESKIERKEGFCVELCPVIGGNAENEKFYKYTPGGNCKLMTINETAADQFIVGKEYYIDFTPA